MPPSELVSTPPAADRHPEGHDAFDARRRARAHAAPAGGSPRERPTWRHVASELEKAAAGANAVDVFVALRPALSLEGVEYELR